MKKIFILLICTFILVGCAKTELEFDYGKIITINIGSSYTLDDEGYKSSNEEVIVIEEKEAKAIGNGFVTVYNDEKSINFYVSKEVEKVVVVNKVYNLKIGDIVELQSIVYPKVLDQSVSYYTNDASVARIEGNKLIGISHGLATITAISTLDETKIDTFTVLVNLDISFEDELHELYKSEKIILDANSNYFAGILEPVISSVVAIVGYDNSNREASGTGFIYKRIGYDVQGNETTNNPSYYEYYVLTNRHVILDYKKLGIVFDTKEVEATLVQYDDKVDVALLKFVSPLYFPTIKLGDSDEVKTGEFVFAIGHPSSFDFINSTTLGVVSYPIRYLSDDTDDDGVNDWDSLYIQHDAAINPGNSGGPLVNLKGEVIGINTLKLSSIRIENMGFAIPINLVKELLVFLEEGIRPKRVTLGIMILSLKDVLSNKEYYGQLYPEIDFSKIPADLTFGFYVTSVDEGKLGYNSGLKVDDIIYKFNGIEMRYSYMLRAEINKYVVGSGERVEMQVYRDGNLITLEVIY